MGSLPDLEATADELILGLLAQFRLSGVRKIHVDWKLEEHVVICGREAMALLNRMGVETNFVLHFNPVWGGSATVANCFASYVVRLYLRREGSGFLIDLTEEAAEHLLTHLPGSEAIYRRFGRQVLSRCRD